MVNAYSNHALQVISQMAHQPILASLAIQLNFVQHAPPVQKYVQHVFLLIILILYSVNVSLMTLIAMEHVHHINLYTGQKVHQSATKEFVIMLLRMLKLLINLILAQPFGPKQFLMLIVVQPLITIYTKSMLRIITLNSTANAGWLYIGIKVIIGRDTNLNQTLETFHQLEHGNK